MRVIVTEENLVHPFECLLNTRDSIIPFSSTVEETTTSLPGVDGEIQLDSRYAAKNHLLVIRSPSDISVDEKDYLYKRISRFLVEGRDKDHEIYYERIRKTYYARVVGEPEKPNEYAGWIEFALPLKSHDPYGYQDTGSQSKGFSMRTTGIFTNRGNSFTFGDIEFVGPCTNPSVTVNGTVYGYTGTVANGYTLVVDSRLCVASMVNDSTTAATNVNINWNGSFLELPSGPNEVNAITNAVGKCTIWWRNRDA